MNYLSSVAKPLSLFGMAGNTGEEINIEAEDWPTLIDATEQFLLELVSHA